MCRERVAWSGEGVRWREHKGDRTGRTGESGCAEYTVHTSRGGHCGGTLFTSAPIAEGRLLPAPYPAPELCLLAPRVCGSARPVSTAPDRIRGPQPAVSVTNGFITRASGVHRASRRSCVFFRRFGTVPRQTRACLSRALSLAALGSWQASRHWRQASVASTSGFLPGQDKEPKA